jgi:hypothetical protein
MSEVRSQGQEIIVDAPSDKPDILKMAMDQALAGWICTKVDRWEDHRNLGYSRRWKEYWRMFRGLWHSDDRTRRSERSKLIAPALAQAIESSAAEVEEILLAKSNWIDIQDDFDDQDNADVNRSRRSLLNDMDAVKAKDICREAILTAAVFGTGIIKMNVVVEKQPTLERDPVTKKLKRIETDKVYVVPESVRPDEFIPDPSAKTINEGLGCGFRMTKPMHYVLEKIATGEYRREALAMLAPMDRKKRGHEADFGVDVAATLRIDDADPVQITEYHGKVPASMLHKVVNRQSNLPADAILEELSIGDMDETELVEAIVTVANDSIILKAMANPFVMRDRSVVATPWERVPGRFWGRGVAEKGWNPQKALDAELRSRQDSLGYIAAPMIGVDSGRLPRGFRMEVKPGKVWQTNGPPSEIIQPLKMGVLESSTFNQTAEMERMVQMGTGAFDTAQALKGGQTQSGANAVGANSMMMGSFVKRAKRAAFTISDNLIEPFVQKSLWRYMQFDPARYPVDFQFKINSAMGIVAREVETMQLTQLLGMMPQNIQPQVHLAVTKGIVELSSVTNKNEINAAIDEALKPPSEEQQQMADELKQLEFVAAKAQAQAALLENQKTMAETRKILNEALVAARKASTEDRKQDGEEAKIMIQLQELEEQRFANRLDAQRLDIDQQRVDNEKAKLRQGQ